VKIAVATASGNLWRN